jgi:hypothetical protein
MSLKNPVIPPGIDPGTVQLVAQRLNHYATPGPFRHLTIAKPPSQDRLFTSDTIITLSFLQPHDSTTPFFIMKPPTSVHHYIHSTSPLHPLYIKTSSTPLSQNHCTSSTTSTLLLHQHCFFITTTTPSQLQHHHCTVTSLSSQL